jgi:hypothetical protein
LAPKPYILRPMLINVEENYDRLALTTALRQALRQAETVIAFVDADEMIDAVKVSGLYVVKDDKVSITLRLTRNNVPLGRPLSFDGKLAESNQLIEQIVTAITQTNFDQ